MTDEPTADEPTADEPTADELTADGPTADELTADGPTTDAGAAAAATDELAPVMEALGHSFNSRELLRQALTHRSQANEVGEREAQHNERLEFLGDAVVNLSVGLQLMERLPRAREGELSKLRAMVVSEASLARRADELALGQHLRLGRGEEQTGGRRKPSILSDVFEALMGAICIDAGFAAADAAVRRLLAPLIVIAEEGTLDRDHKTRLQELTQGRLRQMPRYEVVEERGPDHAKVFTVAVRLADEMVARAEGHSKKAAEQRAARRALVRLEERAVAEASSAAASAPVSPPAPASASEDEVAVAPPDDDPDSP